LISVTTHLIGPSTISNFGQPIIIVEEVYSFYAYSHMFCGATLIEDESGYTSKILDCVFLNLVKFREEILNIQYQIYVKVEDQEIR